MQSIFENESVSSYLNQAHICLIPKTHGPETTDQFRPISLCNTAYKTLTKIIVARFRPILTKAIEPLQSSFHPQRRASDNFIIVQETLKCFKNRSPKQTKLMAIKIDLEKAFGKISWQFIKDMLISIHVPTKLINIIMSCISSSKLAIVVNGNPNLIEG